MGHVTPVQSPIICCNLRPPYTRTLELAGLLPHDMSNADHDIKNCHMVTLQCCDCPPPWCCWTFLQVPAGPAKSNEPPAVEDFMIRKKASD